MVARWKERCLCSPYGKNGSSTARVVSVASFEGHPVALSPTAIMAMRWSPDGSRLLYTETTQSILAFDFQLHGGILMVTEVSTGRAYPIANNAVRGFWVRESR